jgi:hypothetical protein
MHMACMTGMATLMAARRDRGHGTLITLFQPAEETGEGAQDMVDDGLFKRIPVPDVALAQHLLPGIAGTVATCPGPFMSAADSIRVTVHGRGGHGLPGTSTIPSVRPRPASSRRWRLCPSLARRSPTRLTRRPRSRRRQHGGWRTGPNDPVFSPPRPLQPSNWYCWVQRAHPFLSPDGRGSPRHSSSTDASSSSTAARGTVRFHRSGTGLLPSGGRVPHPPPC